jgi:hypothetical protein
MWKSELQPKISHPPVLKRRWLSGRVRCPDEGWSFWASSSFGRIDTYHYEESGRHLTLGGEGGAGTFQIVIPNPVRWDGSDPAAMNEVERKRILFNLTAAGQHLGFSVEFVIPTD